MNLAGIYHRPESEMAYLYTKDVMHIRLKTAQKDGLVSNFSGTLCQW